MISLYSDGSSSGAEGGAGGYGWLISVDGKEPIAWSYGGTPRTTNNLMEIEGCIQALEAALELGLNKPGVMIELVSDSQYALGMASGEWTATKNFREVARLQELTKQVGCRLRWVRGHEGNKYNEICDQLAKQGKIESMGPEQLQKWQKKQRKKKKA